MNRVLCLSLCALVLAAPIAWADDVEKEGCCPVAKQIDTLLGEWKVAQEEAKAMPQADRDALMTQVTTLAQQCPIGSRVGPTLADLQDVLATLVAAQAEGAKHCPLEGKTGADAEACKDAIALKAAHTQLVQNLHSLTTYATGAFGAKAASPTAELPTRIAALKTSWEKAGTEFAALAPEAQKELGEKMHTLCEQDKSIGLIVPTLLAIADGFEALTAIHAKMDEWAQANPQFFAGMSPEAMKGYEAQVALIRSTSEALEVVRATFSHGCCEEEETEAGS